MLILGEAERRTACRTRLAGRQTDRQSQGTMFLFTNTHKRGFGESPAEVRSNPAPTLTMPLKAIVQP